MTKEQIIRSQHQLMVLRNVRSTDQIAPFADDIYSCVQSAFRQPHFDKKDAMDHVKGEYVILACDDSKRIVGFSTMERTTPRQVFDKANLPNKPYVYFAGAAIAQEAQGQGLYDRMNRERMSILMQEHQVGGFFTRTQNPLVETGLTHMLKDLKRQGRISDFSLERIKMPKAYKNMLTGEKPPQSRDEDIQQAYNQLDVEAGDAYVLIYTLRDSLEEHRRRSQRILANDIYCG